MANAPLPVLFTHYGDNWFRGSEQLLMDLITNLDRSRVEPILWCNGEPIADAARTAGILTYRTPFEFYFDYDSPGFSLGRYRSFIREGTDLVRRHDVRVIHANSAAPHQWLLPVARITKRPLLAHLHIDYRRRSRFVCLLHQTTMLVGVSRQVTDDFLSDGLRPDRIGVIYNGINFSRLQSETHRDVRAELGIGPDAVVITVVGSLIRRKGQDLLIRALGMLTEGRDVHLLIASEGPERESYRALAAELNLSARVHFLGYCDDIASLYRASDIFGLPSRGDAFGLVLVEAGYFGLPIVSTRVGGIPEVVEDGVTGLLVPPDDPVALADALRQLVDDEARRRAFGAAGRRRAERMFSVQQMVDRFQDQYERLALTPRSKLGWFGAGLTLKPYFKTVFG